MWNTQENWWVKKCGGVWKTFVLVKKEGKRKSGKQTKKQNLEKYPWRRQNTTTHSITQRSMKQGLVPISFAALIFLSLVELSFPFLSLSFSQSLCHVNNQFTMAASPNSAAGSTSQENNFDTHLSQIHMKGVIYVTIGPQVGLTFWLFNLDPNYIFVCTH